LGRSCWAFLACAFGAVKWLLLACKPMLIELLPPFLAPGAEATSFWGVSQGTARWVGRLLKACWQYLPLLQSVVAGPSSLGIKRLVAGAGALLSVCVAYGYGPATAQAGGAALHSGICRRLSPPPPSCFPVSWMGID
jgi:hypothetical protein